MHSQLIGVSRLTRTCAGLVTAASQQQQSSSIVHRLMGSPTIAHSFLRQQRTFSDGATHYSQHIGDRTPEVEPKKKFVTSQGGTKIPWIGLGTAMNYKATPDDVEAMVTMAVQDAGYRYIDTAYMYNSEAAVGNALKRLIEAGIVKREDLFILSKLTASAMRPSDVEPFLRKSLERLQLDYVDMYLVHSPLGFINCGYNTLFPKDHEERLLLDLTTDHVAVWKKMEEMVDKGLVKAIGLSNFSIRQIKRVLENARIEMANLQVECHAYFQQKELYDFCRKNGITFTAFSPLGSPAYASILSKKAIRQVPVLLDDPALKVIAELHKKTVAQILLRWLFERGMIVVPKSSNPIRIKQNIDIFDFELTEEDTKAIVSLDRNVRIFDLNFGKGMKEHPEYPF